MPRRSRPRTPKKSTPEVEACRAHDVLLEQINSKMDAVIEVATSTKNDLRAEMGAMEERLSERLARVESAVTTHSAEIRGLRSDFGRLRRDFEEAR